MRVILLDVSKSLKRGVMLPSVLSAIRCLHFSFLQRCRHGSSSFRALSHLHKLLLGESDKMPSKIPDHFNFTRDVIDFWATQEEKAQQPAVPALWFVPGDGMGKEEHYSFSRLSSITRRLSGLFHYDLQLGPGDRIMVMLPKVPEFWFITLAALRCGVVLTSCTTMATTKDIELRLQEFGPSCIITSREGIPIFEKTVQKFPRVLHKLVLEGEQGAKQGAREGWRNFRDLLLDAAEFEGEATRTEDPALVFFTSGTTGPPKMVEHCHGYFLAHWTTARHMQCLKRGDLFWCFADPGWAKALWGCIPSWLLGASVFASGTERFSTRATLEMLSKYPIGKMCAPPTVYRMLVQEDPALLKFHSLSDCISAGEPLNPEVAHRWHKTTGMWIREGYGQTETTVLCATPLGAKVKPGSMGISAPGVSLQVRDDAGDSVPVGSVGHVAVRVEPNRPLGLFKCYKNDHERTRAAFRGGFYYTGDRARKDEEGYFWYEARADDVIISAGYRIGPHEVESALMEHPAVVECAVVGSPDRDRGEVVKAFVVLHPDYKSRDSAHLVGELQEFVKKSTAPYKYPRRVEFVEDLPKTISGKILRKVLRDKERLSSEAAAHRSPRPSV